MPTVFRSPRRAMLPSRGRACHPRLRESAFWARFAFAAYLDLIPFNEDSVDSLARSRPASPHLASSVESGEKLWIMTEADRSVTTLSPQRSTRPARRSKLEVVA